MRGKERGEGEEGGGGGGGGGGGRRGRGEGEGEREKGRMRRGRRTSLLFDYLLLAARLELSLEKRLLEHSVSR